MSRYWSPVVGTLSPYVPGEQPKLPDLVKLNTNENPYGPSPKVLQAIAAAAGDMLKLYPIRPRTTCAARLPRPSACSPTRCSWATVPTRCWRTSSWRCSGMGGRCVFPDISYSFYPVYCGLYEIPIRSCRLPMTSASTRPTTSPATRPPAGSFSPIPMPPTGRASAARRGRAHRGRQPRHRRGGGRGLCRLRRPSRSRRWSNATTTCWWSRPCPSRARLPACASVSRWAAGRSSTAWSGSRTASTPIP